MLSTFSWLPPSLRIKSELAVRSLQASPDLAPIPAQTTSYSPYSLTTLAFLQTFPSSSYLKALNLLFLLLASALPDVHFSSYFTPQPQYNHRREACPQSPAVLLPPPDFVYLFYLSPSKFVLFLFVSSPGAAFYCQDQG